jgi:hypothetical protein
LEGGKFIFELHRIFRQHGPSFRLQIAKAFAAAETNELAL